MRCPWWHRINPRRSLRAGPCGCPTRSASAREGRGGKILLSFAEDGAFPRVARPGTCREGSRCAGASLALELAGCLGARDRASQLARIGTGATSRCRCVGVAAGSGPNVFQGAKCLPHVVEVTQCGVELLRVQGDLHLLRGGAAAAIADIQDHQQDDDDGK